jgi:hypothetical protein
MLLGATGSWLGSARRKIGATDDKVVATRIGATDNKVMDPWRDVMDRLGKVSAGRFGGWGSDDDDNGDGQRQSTWK